MKNLSKELAERQDLMANKPENISKQRAKNALKDFLESLILAQDERWRRA